jgi:hypothetical protein
MITEYTKLPSFMNVEKVKVEKEIRNKEEYNELIRKCVDAKANAYWSGYASKDDGKLRSGDDRNIELGNGTSQHIVFGQYRPMIIKYEGKRYLAWEEGVYLVIKLGGTELCATCKSGCELDKKECAFWEKE